MNFISLCSGIEAASVAFGPLGWKAIAFSEIEGFPSAVLAHHYPTVRNYGDMSLFRDWPDELFADADAIVGGPPCQAFSCAGARRGLLDARGNLTLIYVELLNHADDIRRKYGKPPIVALYENVPGIFSDRTNAFGCLVGGLAGEDVPVVPPGKRWTDAGCVFGPERAVAWRLFDAQFFGLAQRRRRVFVVASARKGFDPAQVLFEWDGVRRDTAPSREARQVAPTIPARSTAGGGLGTDFDCDGGTICVATGQAGAEIGADMAPTLNCNHEAPYVAHSLRGEGFDASEDGTGRGTPLVPVGVTIHGTDPTVRKVASYDELAQCLRARTPGNIDNSSTTVVQQPVAYGIRTANTSSNGWGIQEEHTHTLDCAQGVAVAQPVVHAIQAGALRVNPLSGPDGIGVQADHAYTLEARAEVQAVAFAENSRAELRLEGGDGSRCGALSTGGGKPGQGVPMVATTARIRRITPLEAERLMGFPDNYTAIPWRKKPA
ncbi:MAG TPA: DNA cytosine methyltransferase, partial [Acidovorax temperans]|nr:DNA cytosine methyltransferase [Acidovorax temperans]